MYLCRAKQLCRPKFCFAVSGVNQIARATIALCMFTTPARVYFIVFVVARAVGFGALNRAPDFTSVGTLCVGVLFPSHWFQVIWVNAQPMRAILSAWALFRLVADVVNIKTFWYWPLEVLVRRSMRPSVMAVFREHPITVDVDTAYKFPTAVRLYFNSLHQALLRCAGMADSHILILPLYFRYRLRIHRYLRYTFG